MEKLGCQTIHIKWKHLKRKRKKKKEKESTVKCSDML
jgi:hypothetical protein